MKIAFIGLGNMGAPMAQNLLKAGHSLQVYDLNPEPVHALKAAGAKAASSALDACNEVDVLITMLPKGEHVDALLNSGEGLFSQLPAGVLVIDCSTIEASMATALATEAAAKELRFIDAPVSGGIAGAAAGTLAFMVGAAEEDFLAAKPILGAMGQKIFHAGNSGAGQMAKACNNMLLAISMAGTCEVLNMAVKNGLDPAVLSEIMQNSSGGNWVLDVYNPVAGVMPESAASRGYQGGFVVDLMLKDLGLAKTLSEDAAVAVPMGDQARQLFQRHQQADPANGQLDFSSLFEFYNDQNSQSS